MKIEKLTENKIRVIINLEDLEKNNTDVHAFFNKTIDSQGFFFDILKKAEKEVNFHTEGCKLLIEAFSSSDDILVFTITKYSSSDLKNSLDEVKKKKIIAKRKSFNVQNKQAVYSFENFDIFCSFCCAIDNMNDLNAKSLAKNIALYLYNDTYYLILSGINIDYPLLDRFYSTVSEFAKLVNFSKNFECKLLEHGSVIFKRNAIDLGIKYFADKQA